MDEEPEAKVATEKCLLSTTLDPDFYRIGHTKASKTLSNISVSSCFLTSFDFFLNCQHLTSFQCRLNHFC